MNNDLKNNTEELKTVDRELNNKIEKLNETELDETKELVIVDTTVEVTKEVTSNEAQELLINDEIIDDNLDKKSLDEIDTDELKKIFQKMELESEIDKLREDASEKIYHLDKMYLKAENEYTYNNDEKFVFAIFLKEGFNREVDIKRSILLLKELVEIGYLPAMIELGEIYLYGLYNNYKSSVEAKKYFQKATKYGLANPLTFYEKRAYAKALIFGYEIKKDTMKAFSLLKDEQEHPFNESLLGHIFYDDSTTLFSKEKAISHWLIAKDNKESSFLKYLKENSIELDIDNNKMIDSMW